VAQALDALRPASTANKGGFVEKARAALNDALIHVTDCLALLKTHPEIASLPVIPSPEIAAIRARLGEFKPTGRNLAPNLRSALNFLQTALAELALTPTGDRGGVRDQLIGDLGQAVSDLIAGIKYVINPPVSSDPPPAEGVRLEFVFADLKRPLAGLGGDVITIANYRAIIDGLIANLHCNGIRTYIEAGRQPLDYPRFMRWFSITPRAKGSRFTQIHSPPAGTAWLIRLMPAGLRPTPTSGSPITSVFSTRPT
jgi:hypothetical protein